MKYFLEAIKNYAVFQGRASRKEFWMFALFGLLIIPVGVRFLFDDWLGIIFLTSYSLFILIPTLAIMTRRIRDTGKNESLVLLALIPFFGFLIILILCLQESYNNKNEFKPGFVDNNKLEPTQSENPNLYSKTAELDQTSLAKKKEMIPQEASKNKGCGCALASGGLFFGALTGGIIGYIIGDSQAKPGEAILAILYLIIGIPIGAIIGMVVGGILGRKRKS